MLSRWGGDEFVIILPNTSREEVIKVCAKLAAKLSKSHYLSQYDKSVFVTASMGVSFYQECFLPRIFLKRKELDFCMSKSFQT